MNPVSDHPDGLAAYLAAMGATAGAPPADLLVQIADTFGGVAFAFDAEGRSTASHGKIRRAMDGARGRSDRRLLAEVYHDIPEVVSNLRRALAGIPSEFDVTIDGQRFHCEFVPLLGGDGTVTRVVGFGALLDDGAGGAADDPADGTADDSA